MVHRKKQISLPNRYSAYKVVPLPKTLVPPNEGTNVGTCIANCLLVMFHNMLKFTFSSYVNKKKETKLTFADLRVQVSMVSYHSDSWAFCCLTDPFCLNYKVCWGTGWWYGIGLVI